MNVILTDSKRLSILYARALAEFLPIGDPIQLKQALIKISGEPRLDAVFPNGAIPAYLQTSWEHARAARERYITEFAHEVLQRDPVPMGIRGRYDKEGE